MAQSARLPVINSIPSRSRRRCGSLNSNGERSAEPSSGGGERANTSSLGRVTAALGRGELGS